MREYPGRLYHQTPSWVSTGALFHIRWRADPRQQCPLTDATLALELITSVRRYHDTGRWWCELALLMPDHIHAIIAFPATPGMSETQRNWKRGTTRFHGVRWQEGYFDHRLRSEAETAETWHYILRNPVAKTLCASESDWPWWWSASVENPLLPLELRGGAR